MNEIEKTLWKTLEQCSEIMEWWATEMKTGPLDQDTIREKPTLERKREWAHGLEGKGKDCDRYDKRVYTPPESVPGTCHDWNCDNTEYQSKGIVTRNKNTKEVIDRERDRQ